ncbi:MAG: indolepyruvate oxidoreductase subunit beta [Verrucomicrobiota bacterium]|jgi:indolepyruvate ferredoxin oxidoreductase beta subunit
MRDQVINVVLAGLGGQGVLKASDILADAALRTGLDVKKSEIKGMSQRGGSVTSDVRFGRKVLSPMVSPGEADYLLVLEPTQAEATKHYLKPGGVLITPDAVAVDQLPNKKSLNVALLGALSRHLPLPEVEWLGALREGFAAEFFDANRQAFLAGRAGQHPQKT